MPVDVAREHRSEFRRHVGVANDVLSGRELEIPRPNRRTFGCLMHAQHARRRCVRLPVGVGDELRKFRSHVAALARESRQSEGHTPGHDDERARPVEDVDVRMRGKARVRQKGALVISRYDEYGHAAFGHAPQRFERLVGKRRHDGRTVEHVAAVHDDVDLAIERRLQRRGVVGEKVVAAAAPLHARTHGEVEPQVGVGDQQDSNVRHQSDTTLVGVSSVV